MANVGGLVICSSATLVAEQPILMVCTWKKIACHNKHLKIFCENILHVKFLYVKYFTLDKEIDRVPKIVGNKCMTYGISFMYLSFEVDKIYIYIFLVIGILYKQEN